LSDTAPAWSPDGLAIAYAHFDPTHPDTSGLYLADTTGGQIRRLATGLPRSIDWSPDSQHIVYDDDFGIHVVNRDGDSLRTIYMGGAFPSWSYDGSTIAFDTNRHIWFMAPDGSHLRQASSAFPVRMPDWSRDDSRLVVVSYPASAPSGELATLNLSDDSLHPITANSRVNEYPRWSPAGGEITWDHWGATSGGANRPEVWIADSSGSGAYRLIVADSQPSWHPGGMTVVFSMQATDAIHLFAIGLDGTGLRQITH